MPGPSSGCCVMTKSVCQHKIVEGGKLIIIIINPLTARVVGASQIILQPVFSIFSLFSTALWDLPNSRPVHIPDVVFPPLPLSALSSSPFYCALQDGFGQTSPLSYDLLLQQGPKIPCQFLYATLPTYASRSPCTTRMFFGV